MIRIILPYHEASRYYRLWAHEEEKINFRKEPKLAARCTLSFAAEELEHYLTRLGLEVEVSGQPKGQTILLDCALGEGEGYSIQTRGDCIKIIGEGRRGVLYGVYELLEEQGIRWYSPWEEFIPSKISKVTAPECKRYIPSMSLGRGFDFEGPLKESEKLYLWMARNRLNLSACRPNTKQFQRKLGMSFKAGGHIFEHILAPDQATESGRCMLEEHPDWYGKRQEPVTRHNALGVQFCMSNRELLQFLSEQLLYKMQTDWAEADRIDVWGFDTWGSNCQCENCRILGNGSDQTLHFLSYLRDQVNKAQQSGELDHPVQLVMCAYEGTATLQPPLHGVPENLQNSGDYVVYYPILRCYEHELYADDCCYNAYYHKTLEGWKDIPLMAGEYYNVSKFEDLPLVFSDKIQKDLNYYFRQGVTGMTYMHLPMVEWGMRTLNQVLYAKLCWNSLADAKEIKERYFRDLYGPFAKTAAKAYELTEEAGKHCASWRAWGRRSILSHLLDWDGKPPKEGLYRDDHLNGQAVMMGYCSVKLLKQALAMMRRIKREADLIFAKAVEPKCGIAVNPTDTRFKQQRNFLSDRISQDIRGLQYGIDVFLLMTSFVEYYEALEQGNDTEKIWRCISRLCTKMTEYSYSIKYQHPQPELNCVDALERSGLKDLYYRCLASRKIIKKRGMKR